jgi:hypothetical protein
MTSIIVYFKQLSKPVRLTTVYVSALLVYNGGSSYISAKTALNDYTNTRYDRFGKGLIHCKNDFEALKFGSSYNFYDRFTDSIIWPVSVMSNIIPYVALKLNTPKNVKH